MCTFIVIWRLGCMDWWCVLPLLLLLLLLLLLQVLKYIDCRCSFNCRLLQR